MKFCNQDSKIAKKINLTAMMWESQSNERAKYPIGDKHDQNINHPIKESFIMSAIRTRQIRLVINHQGVSELQFWGFTIIITFMILWNHGWNPRGFKSLRSTSSYCSPRTRCLLMLMFIPMLHICNLKGIPWFQRLK